MFVALEHQINPDGIPITIPWDKLEPEQSMFIPCINKYVAYRQIIRQAEAKGVKIAIRETSYRDLHGLRVWRLV